MATPCVPVVNGLRATGAGAADVVADAVAAADVPTALTADTLSAYVVPGTKPEMVQDVAVPATVPHDTVVFPAVAVTT
jgi:hypothetical protein